MTKAEFLDGLRRELEPRLPAEELSDVLTYYGEYFADAGIDREDQVIQELESPAAVAAKVLEDRGEELPPPPGKTLSRKTRLMLLGAGILTACGVLVAALLLLVPSGHGVRPPAPYCVVPFGTDYWDVLDEGICRVEADLPAALITVSAGEERAELHVDSWKDPSYDLCYAVEEGTLRLWAVSRYGEKAAEGEPGPQSCEIQLFLPQSLYRAEVSLNSGSVSVSGLAVEDLDIALAAGDVVLERLTVRTADAAVGTGTIRLSEVEGRELTATVEEKGDNAALDQRVSELVQAERRQAALLVKDCRADTLLKLSCRTGDLAVTGDYPGQVSLDVPGSHCYIFTKQSSADYTFAVTARGGLFLHGADRDTVFLTSGGENETFRALSGGSMNLHFNQVF